MLKQAVERYNIKHAVLTDDRFMFWRQIAVSCWPTIMILGPDNKPFFKATGEGNQLMVQAVLIAALEECLR